MKKRGRPRSRSNRFLPDHVSQYRDRHGKIRHRFRRGQIDHTFESALGTEAFRSEYRRCLDGAPQRIEERHEPGSFNDLIARYYASPRWKSVKRSEATRQHDRRIIEGFRAKHGHRPVKGMKFQDCEKILAEKVATPTAANKLRKQLKRLLGYAVALEMRSTNPMDETQSMEVAGTGHYTWTEDDIASYIRRHPLGSKAYLAMMLMLWTAARRSDAVKLGRGNLKDGWVSFITTKNRKQAKMPLAPQLAEAIVATPGTGGFTFLVTEYGNAFSANGFGNKMRQWCDEAGLPNCASHGLRKAITRRMAELGLTNQQMKAIGTWSQDAEVSTYAKGADQARLAEQAMKALFTWNLSNHPLEVDKSGSENR